MKKFLFVSAIACCSFCMSCTNNSGGLSPAAQKNLDAVHGVNKAFETKDFSKLGDYIAEDCVDHAGDEGDIKGLAAMKVQFEKWAAISENAKTETIKELADDEYVMSWQRNTGTLKVEQMGMKAGDKFDMTAVEVIKFKDGKATEHWSFMSPQEMVKMMPPSPAPSPMPAAPDTTKKM